MLTLGALLAARGADAESCRVSANGLAFGGYDVFRSSPTDSTASITFECSDGGKPISIAMERRRPDLSRVLESGNERLYYNLYLDAARTMVWGDGTMGAQRYYNSNPPTKKAVTVPVYGRILPGQDVGVGQYSDNITVEVNF